MEVLHTRHLNGKCQKKTTVKVKNTTAVVNFPIKLLIKNRDEMWSCKIILIFRAEL